MKKRKRFKQFLMAFLAVAVVGASITAVGLTLRPKAARAYGMPGAPAYDGQAVWYPDGAGGEDYFRVYFPTKIYLDKTEKIEDAGYTLGFSGHYGPTDGTRTDYRFGINSSFWGGDSNKHGSGSAMNDNFTNLSYGAFVEDSWVNWEDWEGYSAYLHKGLGTWDYKTTGINLRGTPKSTGTFTFTAPTGGNAKLAFAYWTDPWYGSGYWSDKKSTSAFTEGKVEWQVIVYDKANLNNTINGALTSAPTDCNNFAAYQKIVADARTVLTTREVTQAQIDSAANAIKNFVFTYSMANYSALDVLISDAGTYEAHSSWYNNYDAFRSALDSAKNLSRDLKQSQQAQVNAAATALNNAMSNLVLKDADFAAYNTQLAKFNELDKTIYTDESVAAVQAILDKFPGYSTKIDKQTELDSYVQSLASAITALAERPEADYSPVTAAIAAYNEKIKGGAYTSVSKKAVEDAIKAVVYDLKDNKQTEVDAMAQAIVTATENLVSLVDYSAIDSAIAAAKAITNNDSFYTDASWSALQTAIENAEKVDRELPDFDESRQTIAALVTALTEAQATLAYKPADLTALQSGYNTAVALDSKLYSTVSWAEVQKQLDAAKALLDRTGLDIRNQAAIDSQLDALNSAVTDLKLWADYSHLEAAITAATTGDYAKPDDFFTAETVTAFKAALTAAQEADTSWQFDEDNQAAVDTLTKALTDAQTALVYLGADYAAVDAAIAAYNNIADKSIYTDASKAIVDAAISAVDRTKNIKEQSDVEAMAAKIVEAFNALALKADYTDYNAVLESCKNVGDEANYKADSWSTYASALAALKELSTDLDKTQQSKINEKVNALYSAIAALVYKDADYTALNALIATVEKLDQSKYTPVTWATLQEKLTSAQGAVAAKYNILEQGKVDTCKTELQGAVDALKTYADYKTLKEAVDASTTGNYANADYYFTADTVKPFKAALEAAQSALAERPYDEDHQADVDALTKALTDAKNNLAYNPADYTAVDTAIASVPKDLGSAGYTEASKKAVTDAVAAVVRDKNITEQATVTGYATAIEAAINGLKLKADYTELDKQIAAYDALVTNKDNYTNWNVAENAYNAAKAIGRDLDVASQNTITEAAAALKKAMEEDLVLKGADYSAVDALIENFKKMTEDAYYQSELKAVQAYIDSIDRSLDILHQSDVDAIVKELGEKLAALNVKPADYTAVYAAKAEYDKLDSSIYTDESWKALQAAYDAVIEGKNKLEQSTVDGWAQAITAAISALEKKPADYTGLSELKASAAELLKATESYTKDSLDRIQAALDAVTENLKIDEQDKVDKMISDLKLAVESVVANNKADYYQYNTALASFDALDSTKYSVESYTKLASAVAAYRNAETGIKPDQGTDYQTTIDAAAAAVNKLIEALEPVRANYDEVDAAMAAWNLKDQSWYTAASVARVKSAIEAVVRQLPSTRQAEVDKMAKEINDAVAALVLADADYSKIDMLSAIFSSIDRNLYTTDSLVNLEVAFAAVQRGYTADKQDLVDSMYKAIEEAYGALAKKLNTADLAAAVAQGEKLVGKTELYTEESLAALTTAINGAKSFLESEKVDTSTNRQEAARLAAAIRTAADSLAYLGADYSKVDKAIGNIPTDLTGYTDATVKALNDAVAAVERGLDITQQAKVDSMYSAIASARAALERKADYTALDKAIADAKALDSTKYVDFTAVKTALDEAQAVSRTLGTSHQSEINAAALKLNNAVAALKFKAADYSQVNTAIALTKVLNKSNYTKESFKAVDEAVSAVKFGYTSDRQADVDAMAQAIYTAITGLKNAADFTELKAQIAAAETYTDAPLYTPESWSAMQNALIEAKFGLTIDASEDEQADIDRRASKLKAAIKDLVLNKADYTELDKVIAAVPADLATAYTKASADAVNAVLAKIQRDLPADRQTDVNAWKTELEAALKAIEKLADYTALDEAIAAAEKVVLGNYENTGAFTAALEAAKAIDRGLGQSKQSDITNTVNALNEARTALAEKGANYDTVNLYILMFGQKDKALYTDASVAAVQNIIDSISWDKKISEQSYVSGIASQLNTAIAAMVLKADYTALDKAIADAAALTGDSASYVDFSAVTTALEAANNVERQLAKTEQATVDDLAKALNDAVKALVLKGVDTTAFKAAEKAYADKLEDGKTYTEASKKAVDDAIAAAQNAVDENVYNIKQQEEFDKLVAAVTAAVEAMKELADYTAIDAAIAEAEKVDLSIYENTAAFEAALAAAKAVDRDLDKDSQQTINDAVTALNEAQAALGKKSANYARVDDAILLASTLDESIYTAASWNALQTAITNVQRDLDITHQGEVDAMAAAIRTAISNLEKIADYTLLDEAIAAAAPYAEDSKSYVDFSAVTAALKAANELSRDLSKAQQSDIDNAAKAIGDAVEKLVLKAADTTAFEAAKTAYNEKLEAGIYTEASKKLVTDAIAAAQKAVNDNVYNIKQQAEFDKLVAAVTDAIGAMKSLADYMNLDEAIAAAEKVVLKNYVDTTAFEAALSAAKAVDRDLDTDNQQTIDLALNALSKAQGELVLKGADYTAVNAQLEIVKTLTESEYTVASWTALQKAVTDVQTDLDITKQDEVDAMATALDTAIKDLKKLADYADLDTAIAKADELAKDSGSYVDFTAVTAALKAAKEVNRDLDDTQQATINDATKALNKAVNELVLKRADYSALAAAKAAYEEKLKDGKTYTEDSKKAVDDAVAAAQKAADDDTFDIKHQADFDKLVTAVTEAMNAMKELADYTALDAAIAEAKEVVLTNYVDTAAFEAAITAAEKVDRDLDKDSQKTIADAAAALSAAKNALVLKGADYTVLNALIISVEALNESDYRPTTWGEVQAKLTLAKAAVEANYNILEQSKVNTCAYELSAAVEALEKFADYTSLEAAVTAATTGDYANVDYYFTSDSAAVFKAALKEAQSALTGRPYNDNQQEAVDALTKALNDAKTGLVYNGADYSAVDEAIATVPADLDTADYTAASKKAVKDAVAAVVTGKDIREQEAVDAMAKAINDAVTALALKADYAALDEQISAYEAKLDGKENYSNWKAAEDAYNAAKLVDRDLAKADQATVDTAAEALKTALESLALKTADYSKVDAQLEIVETLTESDYTVASWTALQTAITNVQTGLDITHQGEVDAMATALDTAIKDLKKLADYTDLDKAIADADELAKDSASYVDFTAVTSALKAAKEVNRDLDDAQQKTITDAADALNKAVNELVLKDVDTAAFEAAKTAYADKLAGGKTYTEASKKAVDDAVAAAEDAIKNGNLTIKDQEKLDDLVAAVTTAVEAMKELADYTDLDAAIAAAKEVVLTNYEDTAAFEAALAAAEKVDRDLDKDSQKTIADAAAALTAAKNALVLKGADYSKLDKAIEAYNAMDKSKYTLASQALVQGVIDGFNRGLDIEDQATVDGYVEALNDAVANTLEMLADYSEIDAALAKATALDKTNYVDFSGVEAAVEALNGIKTNQTDLGVSEQNVIDEAIAAIDTAINELVYIDADYSKVDEAIASIPEDLSIYTDATVKAVNDAENAVERGLTILRQADVDNMAKAIENAVEALIIKDADLTPIDEAKARATALVIENYTDETVAKLNEAIKAADDAIEEGLDITDTERVLALAKAINDAVDSMELKPADYTDFNAVKAQFEALDVKLYTEESAGAAQAIIDGLDRGLKITSQGIVNEAKANLENAVGALVYRDADFTALKAEVAKVPADLSIFTDETAAALNEVLATITYSENITQQDAVDAQTAALRTALASLTIKAYEIISVSGGVWSMSNGAKLVITCNGDIAKFIGLNVDGVKVDASNYTLTEGSTIVAFNDAYLNTLAAGEHTAEFLYTDGSASATFVVEKEGTSSTDGENNGGSGDSTIPSTGVYGISAVSVLGASAAVILVSAKRKKKDDAEA